MFLPQCKIIYSPTVEEGDFLLVSGGRFPSVDWFKKISYEKKIFCIDRGIDFCKAMNILPDSIIGDFDSAKSLSFFTKKNIPVEYYPVDKDFTDTQLAVKHFESLKKNSAIIITGVFGGRFDHLFSTIFTCASTNLKIFLADDKEIIFYLREGESAEIKFFEKPLAISLLPMTEICTGVNIKNVRWELNDATLKQNFPNAVSNRPESDEVKINIKTGIMAVYFCFGDFF